MKKSKTEILDQYYVNKSDIALLLGIPRTKAALIFQEIDREEEKNPFRAHQGKVPLERVLNLAGVNYKFLTRQVRGGKENG